MNMYRSLVCISVVVLLCHMPGTSFVAAAHINKKRATTTENDIMRGMASQAINAAEVNKKALDDYKQSNNAENQAVKAELQAVKTELSLSGNILDYKKYPYKNCAGNDIAYQKGLNLGNCANKCHRTSNCVAFHLKGDECWTKSSCDVSSLADHTTGNQYVRENILGYNKYANKHCGGNDIANQKGLTVGDCAAKCHSTSNCMAFHFKGDECWTKSSCDVNSLANTQGDQYIWKSFLDYTKYESNDCGEHDIAYQNGLTVDGCALKCHRTSNCVAFHFKGGECWTKWKCDISSLAGDQYIRKQ